MKLAFVFPGQGTQRIGMGKEFYDTYPVSKAVYEAANAATGRDISGMCFEGPEEALVKTVNQQPTIHTTELAILAAVTEAGIKPDVVAGFSLGEYAALVCAGVLDGSKTAPLVSKRGELIQACVEIGVGKMAAISAMERADVEGLVASITGLGVIECSNYNCPGQTIVSGHNAAVDAAMEKARALGGKVAELKVSAPFHTSLIKDAGTKLHAELDKMEVNEPNVAYIPNVTAKPYDKATDDIRNLMDLHVSYPVRWEDSVYTMLDMGVDVFVEIGPAQNVGKYIDRTVKKVGAQVDILTVSTVAELEALVEFVKGK